MLIVVFWMFGAVMACRAPAPTPKMTPAPTATPSLAELRIAVLPLGSTVYVDGEEKGHTALRLDLPAGQHRVLVEHKGYTSLQRDVQLSAGQAVLIAEALHDSTPPLVELSALLVAVEAGESVPIRARATDNERVAILRLAIDGQQVTEVRSATLEYVWDTRETAAGNHTVVVEAQDAAGNVGQSTHTVSVLQPTPAQATATPMPAPTAQPSATTVPGVRVYETQVTLSAYPYEPYLREKADSRYNWRVVWLDRSAYEASNPQPEPRTFKAIVLENAYLRLTFLPELGGRLYQCIFKPTGQKVFYQNEVLKPSYWGPLDRAENWWLAAGGMEWALPVHEHGYEWGLPWTYRIESKSSEASIILQDSTADDRLRAQIRVTLPVGRAYFVVQPTVINPTAQPVALQFWLNAQLSLGSRSTSPNTEFIYPTEQMIVHSTGDSALPGERQAMPWPIADGRDFSRYGNWRNWLGVFVPEVKVSYTGAYNHDTDLGIARIFPPEVARGLKLFGFGAGFAARAEYTDDGSEYFELWAGPCRTFWPEDEVTVGAGQSLGWSEVWLPFNAIGGLDAASADVVARAEVQDSQVRLGLAASRDQRALLDIQWNGQTLHQETVQLDPEKPVALLVSLPPGANPPGRLTVHLTDLSGKTLLEYDSVR